MILNCVVIPDEKSSHTISNIMHNLSERSNSKNALEFIPHFSIRNDFEIEIKDVDKLKLETEKILKDFKPFTLKITQYGFYPWKIVYLDIDVTPELQRLHNVLMNTIKKYRTSMVTKTLLESSHFEGKQRQYIEIYGYQFAFEYYSPHFTVAGKDMTEESFERLKKELSTKKENIVVTTSSIMFMNREQHNKPEIVIPL
jgi:2'-5' RNA ligase